MTLIVEPSFAGHRLEYVDYLTRGALERGSAPKLLTTQETFEVLSENWGEEFKSRFTKILIADKSDRVFTSPRKMHDLALESNVFSVLVPAADGLIYKLGALGGWGGDIELHALLIRSPWVSPRNPARDILKKILVSRAAAMKSVNILHLRGIAPARNESIATVRDCSRWSRQIDPPLSLEVKLDADRFWYAIFGEIDSRKNIDLVLRALSSGDGLATGLLLAGKVDPRELTKAGEAIKEYQQFGGQIRILNRYLSEVELDWLVSQIDCVVCAHSNEGPSGIALKAAHAGQRLLTAGAKSLLEETRYIPDSIWVDLNKFDLARGLSLIRETERPKSVKAGSPESFASDFLGQEL